MSSLNRIVMQKASRKLIRKLRPSRLDAVEVSGKTGQGFAFKSYRSFRYPAHDICAAPFREKDGALVQADIVLANQVWEHLDRPYGALGHVRAMLRPGGFFWIACPFLVRVHGAPVDNSRWTARGMRNLLLEGGFAEDQVVSYQWGNRAAVVRNLFGAFPPEYDRDSDDLVDEPDFPVAVWALARMSGPGIQGPLARDLEAWPEELPQSP